MRIWIDADACPKAAKELVCKFALKRKLEVWMVAGQPQVKTAVRLRASGGGGKRDGCG